MTRELDAAKLRFDAVAKDIRAMAKTLRSEAETRLHIVDRILIEVLRWPRDQVTPESSTDSGYIDYLIGQSGRTRWVVEAKRRDATLINVHDEQSHHYKVGGPALKSAGDGIAQAQRYCAEQGAMFAAVTSGEQWLGIWVVRSDGIRPALGSAIVFPSLEAIQGNFATFYELYSPEGMSQQLYQSIIHEAEGLKAQPAIPLMSAIQPHEIRMLSREAYSLDLQQVFVSFFSSLAGDDDPEMLRKCFVESTQSREADAELRRIAETLVNHVRLLDPSQGAQLQTQIETALESRRGEFVVIIGGKGAGKSTFIDRFFRHVLARPLQEQCIVARIDLADAAPDAQTVVRWMTARLRTELEHGLFEDGIPTFEELQGTFYDVYRRWQKGELRHLYESDKGAFKIKFGEWIARLIDSDPLTYVLALLRSAVNSRKVMPCIVFDNADQHPKEIQEAVFQFAQSIFRQTFTFMVCPVTDRTIWTLSKAGPLQSYHYRALYLPVPAPRDVIAMRVAYLREKVSESESDSAREYFVGRGLKVHIPDIKAFASVVERIFVQEEYIGKLVGFLSNFDIRRSLRIAERIITSPLVRLEDLVKAYVVGTDARLRRRDALRGLICGDYQHFIATNNEFVMNVFYMDSGAYMSPLLRLSILRFLRDRDVTAVETDDAYVQIADVLNYFEPCGVSRRTGIQALSEMLTRRNVEPYVPAGNDELAETARIKIARAGRQHYDLCFSPRESGYLLEMALTTAIRDESVVMEMRTCYREAREWPDYLQVIQQFVEFVLREDANLIQLPTREMYEGQRDLRKALRGAWFPPQVATI